MRTVEMGAGVTEDLRQRLRQIDWAGVCEVLDRDGHATIDALLSPAQCDAVAAWYDQPERFRSRVVMARHGFGRGEYQYFADPLPESLALLRSDSYPPLVGLANRWQQALGAASRFPGSHREFLQRCHDAGQCRPTPLLLRYGAGDYNCLHQDLYGEQVFPIQMAILLSSPGADFEGGEFVITEQRPRMQSRVDVVALGRGDAVVFAVNERPVSGSRGFYRVRMRHGVSRVRRGQRHVLGVIFHDAA